MKKGDFGYISFMKKKSGISAALLALAAASLYFTGLHFFPQNRTAVGIVTVVVCIPAAMALVRFIMFMRFPSGSREIYELTERIKGRVPVFYDSIITTPDKSYGVNVFIASEGSLIGLTEYDGVDIQKLEKHLKDLFTANKYHELNIRVFTDRGRFTERLEALAKRQDGGDLKKELSILHLIGRLSL
ncbi:MAG: hypothetical protein J5966_02515 [Lachnospiraceae bacterium]|nr:hypothetical protein [Lachnospiraceae bacterium]